MKYSTFTGVDCSTDLKELAALSATYPFIEWGVLVSHDRASKEGRYPTVEQLAVINEFAGQNPSINFAYHLCGKSAAEFILQPEKFLYKNIKRVQLNIVAKKFDAAKIASSINMYPHIQFITQYNHNNRELTLPGVANHALLFDSSGGNGVSPKDWPEPIEGKFCGYAGGLGSDNILEQMLVIDALSNNYWIDMEQKLRVNDVFNLKECADVARYTQIFASKTQKKTI